MVSRTRALIIIVRCEMIVLRVIWLIKYDVKDVLKVYILYKILQQLVVVIQSSYTNVSPSYINFAAKTFFINIHEYNAIYSSDSTDTHDQHPM